MNTFTQEQKKEAIAQNYAKIASTEGSYGCCAGSCGDKNASLELGYSQEKLNSIPDGADKGLGCGNPLAIASLKKGETVLDLGSGAGLDCFLASKEVGTGGKVIGVDMTSQMVAKSRSNKDKYAYKNVDFRLGEIENLPVADKSVDAIISNCVINLSFDKQRVFDESYRVLKIGGRLAISDIVLTKKIPPQMISLDNYGNCIAGASFINDLKELLENSGFKNISITPKNESKKFLEKWSKNIENFIVSANIVAIK